MVLDALTKDFPEQFKNRKNIGGLAKAFDRQLSEVYTAFSELGAKRCLDNATGVQLDRAGDIVCLTRADAGLLSGDPIEYEVLDDERYRRYLKYKAHRNSNDCTYYDLVKELLMVWDVDSIIYTEEADYPATIIISAPLLSPDGGTANLGQIPAIKPAGVSVLYRYRLRYVIQVTHGINLYATDYPLCGTMKCGTYPVVATQGNGSSDAIEVGTALESNLNNYDICGTKPQIATIGCASNDGVKTADSAEFDKHEYLLSGTAACGKYF